MPVKPITGRVQRALNPAFSTDNPVVKGASIAAPTIIKARSNSNGYSFGRLAAYLCKRIPESEVAAELNMSERLKAMYGTCMPFDGGMNTILVPQSARFIPQQTINGQMIHGAPEIVKEIGEYLAAGMDQFDPDEARITLKSLGTTDLSAGASLVPGPGLGDLIDLQRNAEVFSRAGASNIDLPGMVFDYPKLAGGATSYWINEAGSFTESQQVTGNLRLQAKKLGTRVKLNNELLRFTSPTTEGLIRNDMSQQAALAMDLASLEGKGGSSIMGIINFPTMTTWTQGTDKLLSYTANYTPADGNTGYVLQPEDIIRMESYLPDAIGGATRFVMRKPLFGMLTTRRASAITANDGAGQFVQGLIRNPGDDFKDVLNGVTVLKSNQVSATRVRGSATNLTYVLGGNFPDWIIARFGIAEFALDPYTALQTGQTILQQTQFCDAGPRHSASFVLCDQLQIA